MHLFRQVESKLNQNQIFVYCKFFKEKTIYILTIAVKDAIMIYSEKALKLTLFHFTISKDP